MAFGGEKMFAMLSVQDTTLDTALASMGIKSGRPLPWWCTFVN